MSYIGNEPIVSATRTVTEVTATAGQTVFNANGGYTVGYLDVFLNGAQLQNTDFTATNGSSVTLTEAAQVNDVVRLVAWGTFSTSTAVLRAGDTMTGALLLPDGSASAPALSNDGDSNTGIFFPAADTIAFTEGGTESMRIDSSGNVGIGTSSNLTSKLNFDASDRGETINIYSNASESSRSGIGKYANETRYYVGSTDFFAWRTGGPSGTERMRLTTEGNGGRLLIGTTSGGFSKTNYGCQFNRDDESFILSNTPISVLTFNRNNNGDILRFNRDGTQRGWISVDTTGTTYGNLSDRRAKENFTPSPPALTKLENVEIVSFDWKEGGHTEYGTVAQDLANTLPFAVTVGDNAEEIAKPWGVDYSKVVPVLIKAIQEQQVLIQSQADTITAMELRLTALENK